MGSPTYSTNASPSVSCLGWSQAIPGGQSLPECPRGPVPGAGSLGGVRLGWLRPTGSPRGPPAGRASAAPCLLWSLACGDRTGQRWVSRVTEGSLRWGCGYVRHGSPACPVHGGVSGCRNRGPCTQWSPQPASRRTSRAVTVIESVGPRVRTAQVQILPLPLPSCGILG